MKPNEMTKQELIDRIMEDIRENEYDSRDLLFDLAESYLDTKTKDELLNDYFADLLDEDIDGDEDE